VVVVAYFMLDGSAYMFVWTGDRALGVCAAFCVCRTANVVEKPWSSRTAVRVLVVALTVGLNGFRVAELKFTDLLH
jgi:hypothetical protein